MKYGNVVMKGGTSQCKLQGICTLRSGCRREMMSGYGGNAVSPETLLLRKPDEIFPAASNTRITGVTEHLILRYFIVVMITVKFISDK
jgi:hypothetical protein